MYSDRVTNNQSLPCRTLPLPSPLPRNFLVPILRPRSRVLLHLCQSYRSGGNRVEMATCVCVLVGVRDCVYLLLLSRDVKSYFGGIGFQ